MVRIWAGGINSRKAQDWLLIVSELITPPPPSSYLEDVDYEPGEEKFERLSPDNQSTVVSNVNMDSLTLVKPG